MVLFLKTNLRRFDMDHVHMKKINIKYTGLLLLLSLGVFPLWAQKASKPQTAAPLKHMDSIATKSFNSTEEKIIRSNSANTKLHVYQVTDNKELKVLKRKSSDIRYDDPLLPILEQRMYLTVQDPMHTGVGIAAPQVGINKNLIWVQRFDKSEKPFEFYINPQIIWRSALTRLGVEGCLSIPDRKEDIQRSYAIRLRYQNKNGTFVEENIEGFTAVIFQHEIDHLFGILYPDRLKEQQSKELIELNERIKFSIDKNLLTP